MKKEILNCEKARSICIVQTLAKLGHFPNRRSEKEAWFLSPLRSETQASFKVTLKLNRWYDHGAGIGGNVIDLVCLIKQCSIKEALHILINESFPFTTETPVSYPDNSGIEILSVKKLQHPALLDYLKSRGIDHKIASRYCYEVNYTCKGKKYFAIGLQNKSGGYELRNKFYKNGSSPKDISLFKTNQKDLIICEGLFDLLSLLSYSPTLATIHDFLVLNSVAYIKRVTQLLTDYKAIYLYLDRDNAGRKATQYLLAQNPHCKDRSDLYEGFNDLIDWWLFQKQQSG